MKGGKSRLGTEKEARKPGVGVLHHAGIYRFRRSFWLLQLDHK
ncbi:hypothetical protein [Terribacillus saccharophilus]|nr:hypothetical protein [Terribacillus saccharophilus]